MYSALSLIIVIASMGGLFLLLHATFLAVLQIIIYAGAVMTLFVFVIMMVDIKGDRGESRRGLTFLVFLVLAVIAALSIYGIGLGIHTLPPQSADFSVRAISRSLFSAYVFPFEAIGLLIVASVIGALYIARREEA
jgi:NADH-quinone oxidoreductase subunit J